MTNKCKAKPSKTQPLLPKSRVLKKLTCPSASYSKVRFTRDDPKKNTSQKNWFRSGRKSEEDRIAMPLIKEIGR